jgi:hypothetical protein
MRNPQLWYIHFEHCIDILMQNIVCTANTDLVILNWRETQSNPFPDFSTNNQCRDFNTLVQWRKDNSVDIEKWIAIKKPDGVRQVPAPKAYYEKLGTEEKKGVQLTGCVRARKGPQCVPFQDHIRIISLETRGMVY